MPAEPQPSRPSAVVTSIENDRALAARTENPFSSEIALYEKVYRKGYLHALVVVPDFYRVALPNIGHQIVEHVINQTQGFFASRCYLNEDFSLLRECPEAPDLVLVSMSYEGSYIRALRVLDLLGLAATAESRSTADPLVVIGGRAVSMNPMPLFRIADVLCVGDSDRLVQHLCQSFREAAGNREQFFDLLVNQPGFLVPSRYQAETRSGYLDVWKAHNAPQEIQPGRGRSSHHSWYLSAETDYNDIAYYQGKTFFSVEIVKACASRCLFCAEGYNNGRMRFTDDVTGISSMARWAKDRGADIIKLFFPANSTVDTTKRFLSALLDLGLPPRVGSAKAEKIDDEYIELVGRSGQEKIAIAPETGDYVLRMRLGKPGMTDEVLMRVIQRIVDVGIPNLDLYFIANLPGEAPDSFGKTIDFISSVLGLLERRAFPGRFRISMPNFFPKAWTPFQYAPAGDIAEYERRIDLLEETFGSRVKVSHMKGNMDLLSQNVMSRGGEEVGALLSDVYGSLRERERELGRFEPDTFEDWRRSFARLGLSEDQYFRERRTDRPMPWHPVKMYEPVQHLVKAWEVFCERRGSTS